MELTIDVRKRRAHYVLTLDLRGERSRPPRPESRSPLLKPSGAPHEVAMRHILASGSRPVAPIR
jgi:hypothetical protein